MATPELSLRAKPVRKARAPKTGQYATNNKREDAQFYSRSHDALIRIYDDAGNVIQTHDHKGDFKEHPMNYGCW